MVLHLDSLGYLGARTISGPLDLRRNIGVLGVSRVSVLPQESVQQLPGKSQTVWKLHCISPQK